MLWSRPLIVLGFAAAVCAVAAPGVKGEVTLYNYPVLANAEHVEPGEELEPIRITGTRNGRFSGSVAVRSESNITGLEVSVEALSGEGRSIGAENIQVRYAAPFPPTTRRRPAGLDVLLPSPPERSHVGIWITVTVPEDAEPGDYEGRLTVSADGLSETSVPVKLYVAGWRMSDASRFRTWIDLLQSPDTLALEYEVDLWSEEHWELIAESFRQMSVLGNSILYIPVMARTNFGNSESMIRWIETEEGEYEHDFSIMERYLDLAQEHMGTPTHVVFVVWDLVLAEDAPTPHVMSEEAVEAREELAGRGPRVTAYDPATEEVDTIFLPRYEHEDSRAIWQPFFTRLRERMRERDLEEAMMLGMLSDAMPAREEVELLHEVSDGLTWVSHAHPNRMRGRYSRGPRFRDTAYIAYEAHVYRMRYHANPERDERLYGWKIPELNAHFGRNGRYNGPALRARILPEKNITGEQRGVGRIGADFWYVVEDQRGRRRAAAYHRYPENLWRNIDIEGWILAPGPDGPVGTARLENMREGLQEAEARIFLESVILDEEARRLVDQDTLERARAILDERQIAIWRSVWPYNDDVLELGHLGDHGNARNPIEAVWQALNAAGRDLPGYWDSEARQMRSEAVRKGQEWFAASDWKGRNRQLFDIAAEICNTLSAEGVDTYQIALNLRKAGD